MTPHILFRFQVPRPFTNPFTFYKMNKESLQRPIRDPRRKPLDYAQLHSSIINSKKPAEAEDKRNTILIEDIAKMKRIEKKKMINTKPLENNSTPNEKVHIHLHYEHLIEEEPKLYGGRGAFRKILIQELKQYQRKHLLIEPQTEQVDYDEVFDCVFDQEINGPDSIIESLESQLKEANELINTLTSEKQAQEALILQLQRDLSVSDQEHSKKVKEMRAIIKNLGVLISGSRSKKVEDYFKNPSAGIHSEASAADVSLLDSSRSKLRNGYTKSQNDYHSSGSEPERPPKHLTRRLKKQFF